jgi:Cupin domain
LAALSLIAESPGQTDQITIQLPHPDMPDATHGKLSITHKSLLRSDLDGMTGQEVIVWDTEYEQRAINPAPLSGSDFLPCRLRNGHLAGRSKAPVTLKAGDSLFTPAGTTHTHWNPSPRRVKFVLSPCANQTETRPVGRAAPAM